MREHSHVPILRLQLLGTPQFFLDDQPLHGFVTRKAQALFIYLATTPQAHARDAIASLFWGELTDQQARNNLRRVLPNLRDLVGSYLHITRELVAFDRTRSYTLDTVAFVDALNACMANAAGRSIEHLSHALAIYRGDFLEGFSVGDAPEFEAWALVQRENLRRMAIWGFDQLAAAYLEQSQFEQGLEVTARLLALEPWYEAAYHKQMIALAHLGQRTAALGQYEKCREILVTEFGAEPAAEMTALYEQLKRGETGIVPPGAQSVDDEKTAIPSPAGMDQSVERAPSPLGWGMVPRATSFYGRQYELTQLKAWILQEQCAVVALLGVGGVGKTALATQFVRKLQTPSSNEQFVPGFDCVLWRSLLNAPPLDEVVDLWLQELSGRELTALPPTLNGKLSLLATHLRSRRCLLVLDNLESVLQAGDTAGQFLTGYDNYAHFFQQMGELEHQSCLLITSRELPLIVARLERTYSAVRSLRLEGLPTQYGLELLRAAGLDAPTPTLQTLLHRYSGNPLALRLVAEVVIEHYAGDLDEFLAKETLIFEDIRSVLDQQLNRLTALEREILIWLAIEREPVSLQNLTRNFVRAPDRRAALESLRSLYRRSMVEWDKPPTQTSSQSSDSGEVRFALQNVVLEYTTEQLRDIIVTELEGEKLDYCQRFALVKAQDADYVGEAQIRSLLQPIAARLRSVLGQANCARKLQRLLALLRNDHADQAGFAPANLLHLALQLELPLHGWDFSHLPIWQADLRKAHLPHTNFAHSHFSHTAFVRKFDAILAVSFSNDGELLAAGGASSNIHLWRMQDRQLLRVYPGSNRWVWTVAFSPNGRILASGGSDCLVRLWDVPPLHGEMEVGDTPESDTLGGHTDSIFGLAFHPNGRWLASGSADHTVRLWDVARQTLVRTLNGHSATVYAVAFDPHGRILATGSRDQTVRLWRVDTGDCLQLLPGHQSSVIAVHFSADGGRLVTASVDGMVQIWQVHLNEQLAPPLCALEHSYYGELGDIATLALSPDGEAIATNGPHATVRFRARATGALLNTFHGHAERSQSLAFHPNGKLLVSGGWDQSVRFWDVTTGNLLRTLQGYINAVNELVISPDGHHIVSANRDGMLALWTTRAPRLLQNRMAHRGSVQAVAFHRSGKLFASGGSDGLLRLWRVEHDRLVEDRTLQRERGPVHSLAFSPSGHCLASSSEDQTVCIWDTTTWECRHIWHGPAHRVGALVFDPSDAYLLMGSEDGQIYRWTLPMDEGVASIWHPFAVIPGGCTCLALSPDAAFVAGAGADHVIRLWRIADGELIATAVTPINSTVYSLVFYAQPEHKTLRMFSSSGTGAICAWDFDLVDKEFTLRYLLSEHKGSVQSIGLTPDGQTLVSGSADETIRFWRANTGACLHTLQLELPYAGMNIAGATGLTDAQRRELTSLGATNATPMQVTDIKS